ncbi:MAG: hypothetical protein ABI165_07360 [Bryobacteraceae bacterium]
MPIYVFNCKNQLPISNATFTVPTANNGGGHYYMYVYAGANFCVAAPGYGTVCGNTDSYYTMWASLCPYTPPPPPTCGCWS